MRQVVRSFLKYVTLRGLGLLFFLILVFNVTPQSKDQRWSFHFEDVLLRDIIDSIEENTGRVFIYNSLLLNLEEKCTLNVDDVTLGQLLTSLFEPFDVFFKVYGKQIVVAQFGSFREGKKISGNGVNRYSLKMDSITVSGVVSGVRGHPLEGVNVVVHNGRQGTVTDKYGQFSMKVFPLSYLTFSHIGFESFHCIVGDQRNIRVVLFQNLLSVPEIVVTALNIERKRKALGFAYADLEGSVMSSSNAINPVNSLMGRVTGLEVQPSDGGVFGSSRITIRGSSTFRENNQPVFVVDGIIFDNDIGGGDEWGGLDWGNNLKSLNPDDFESVTVLKGAAATALYGSKAMNGVVLVNTKKGKKQDGVGVNVAQTFLMKKVYDGPDFQDVYGAGTVAGYATYLEDRFAPSSGFRVNLFGEPVVNNTVLSYGPAMDKNLRVRYRDGELINYGSYPDNYLESFENGVFSNTHISVNGKKDEVSFRLSYSNTREKGVYFRNDFKRNAISGNILYKFKKQINAEFLFFYSGSSLWNPPSGAIQQAFLTSEIGRDYDAAKWKKRYRAPHGGIPSSDYDDLFYQIPGHSEWFSYYEDIHFHYEEGSRFIGRIYGTLLPWLKYDVTGSVNNFREESEEKIPGQGYNNQGGYYGVGDEQKKQQVYRARIDGEIELGVFSRIKLTMGAELFDSDAGRRYSNTVGGLMVPGKYSLEYSMEKPETRESVIERLQTQSIFFLGEWGWKDQLFVTATARNDWSSALVSYDGSGSTGFFYPSLSLSWMFSESYDMPSWLSFGKFRASWAQVGNGLPVFNVNHSFKHEGRLENNNSFLPLITHSVDYVRSGNLRPERKQAVEAGFELNFLKNRVNVDFSWYQENTYDQIITVASLPESGVDKVVKNAGDVLNKGVELSVNTLPVKRKDFEFSAGFYFSRNRNRVVSLDEGVSELVMENSTSYGNVRTASVAMVGKPFGVLVSDASPLLYYNAYDVSDKKNGWPQLKWDEYGRGAFPVRSNRKRIVGDMNPDFYGGIQLGLKFRNFLLTGLFDYKIGGDIVSYSNRYGMAYGLLEGSLRGRDEGHGGISWMSSTGNFYQDGIIPRGVFEPGTVIDGNIVGGMSYQEAYEQGIVEPEHASFWYFFSGNWETGVVDHNMILENSYLGIREVRLSFSFSGPFYKHVKVQGGSVSLFGRDLGFVYKSLPNNLNPFGTRSNRAAASHEWGLTPYSKTIGVELKLNF